MSGESAAFYDQMATIREPYWRLADAIWTACDMTTIDTVLDIGCGLGAVIERLFARGATVIGWDSPEAEKRAHCPRVVGMDLTKVEGSPLQFDVVICTETAEHLAPEFADRLVQLCVSAKPRLIVWSAAEPGDEWEGHVNLQRSSYWLDKLSRTGYASCHTRTERLRIEMILRHAQHEYGVHKFFVLEPR